MLGIVRRGRRRLVCKYGEREFCGGNNLVEGEMRQELVAGHQLTAE